MNVSLVTELPKRWLMSIVDGWDEFWFKPRLPHTLCLLRILTGAMLLYGHIVLATELTSFLGDDAWINNELAQHLHDGEFQPADMGRSYLWYLNNPLLLWGHHGLTILVTAAFMIGLLTRITGPAAWLLQLMYIHRLTGTLFGLDQIVTYCAMYLMFAPCGSAYSVDAWLREKFRDKVSTSRRLAWLLPEAAPSVAANLATRLLQLHLCVIYLFGGLAKARGTSWWDGSAVWYAVGNYEYQSIDMTWLAKYPLVFSALSNITLFWETFYCALVWPKRTRVLVLAIAIGVHGGIALFLGMATFGLMMIAANMIFVEPEWLLRLFGREQVNELESSVPEEDGELTKVADASAGSVTVEELDRRKAKLRSVAKKLKAKSARLKERHNGIREREARYRKRKAKLKEREAKLKAIAERRRARKQSNSDEAPAESTDE